MVAQLAAQEKLAACNISDEKEKDEGEKSEESPPASTSSTPAATPSAAPNSPGSPASVTRHAAGAPGETSSQLLQYYTFKTMMSSLIVVGVTL